MLDQYKIKKRLGSGTYGDVYLVEDEERHKYAMKLIKLKVLEEDPDMENYFYGEVECLKSMNSPHIIRLLEIERDENYLYLLLEYCDGGDLFNYQSKQKDKVFEMNKATEMLKEVIEGLEDLHLEGYVHRDIKTENILIKNEMGRDVVLALCRSSRSPTSDSPRRRPTSAAPSWEQKTTSLPRSTARARTTTTASRSTCGPLASSSTSCSTCSIPSVLLASRRTQLEVDP
jgi:serine/threonine protein kinase